VLVLITGVGSCSQKDAEAICEAMSRPNMRFATVKRVEQQDVQATHRIRAELMTQRTAKANQIRGLVAEYGLVTAKHLSSLRGVGPMTSTAMIATVGDARQYQKSRQMAAAIGITPKQHSSGDRDRLLGISKRGDVYLRTLMIHGARAVVARAKHKDDRLSRWVTNIANKKHPNVAAVALANKTARMAWAMLRHETDYDPDFAIEEESMYGHSVRPESVKLNGS
jgi:transposase